MIPTPLSIAGPTAIAFTSDLDFRGFDWARWHLSPFHLVGFNGLLVYDDVTKDNYDVPGVGLGIENPQIFDLGRKILFNREDGTIWFWDFATELVGAFNDVNNGIDFAVRPSITQDGTVMTFVSVPNWSWGHGVAMIWINGVLAELAKVNAVGALSLGISWIRISANGRWVVFTTGDGGLFVYDLINSLVTEVTDARVVGGFSTHPDISPDGSQIVWTGIGLDGSLRIFRYDRLTRLVDPMPFANLAMNSVATLDPRFLGPDGTWIVYDSFIGNFPAGGFRVLGYNWLTEAVRTFSILNSVTGVGDQLVSDTGN